jgi:transcription-repair coupling factor (superfamily II helicase)
MAIAGFRDASPVTTPPPERRPINTVLATYDATVVREAVQAELDRDGQIFYVVPKIGMMEEANKRLKSIFPNLRVMQAHGQMKGEQLDAAMDEFASGQADVLLCTTIVESGLDIPNVNTIIIEEVQQFGLASLYQLRGRVGRAGRQAYAYMFHAEMGDMREEAHERLLALEECCGLGEGFKLAERDMAIRGVGTIFGDKQSGEVDSIGADLYLELLYNQLEKIEKLRLNPVAPQDVRTPDWSSPPMLGGEYVATADARAIANESLSNARTVSEIEKVLESLTACFGEARDARTVSTINFHRMRVLAGELGVTRVSMDSDSGVVLFTVDADVEVKEMLVDNLDDIYRKDLTVVDEGIRMVSLAGAGVEVTLAQAVNALRRVNEALPSFIKFL